MTKFQLPVDLIQHCSFMFQYKLFTFGGMDRDDENHTVMKSIFKIDIRELSWEKC